MRVDVYSCQQACTLTPLASTVVISISSPGETASIKEGWPAVLRLKFHDIVRLRTEMPVLVAPKGGKPVLFDEVMAAQIDAFVWAHKEKDFMIHCDAGQSRSVAVGVFIKDVFEGELCLHAVETAAGSNSLVHRLLMKKYWEERLL